MCRCSNWFHSVIRLFRKNLHVSSLMTISDASLPTRPTWLDHGSKIRWRYSHLHFCIFRYYFFGLLSCCRRKILNDSPVSPWNDVCRRLGGYQLRWMERWKISWPTFVSMSRASSNTNPTSTNWRETISSFRKHLYLTTNTLLTLWRYACANI